MSNFSALIATIQAYIKTNGNEEITGAVLQDVLEAMVDALGTEAINDLETALSNEVGNRQNADTALGNAIGAIEDAIENGYVYAGIATPSSTPVSGKVFYLTAQAGTYTNFGGVTVTAGITILKYNGSAWVVEQLISMADIYRNPLMGYYECSTAGSTDAKTVNATGYVLPTTGGSVKIKMDNRNTVANATLQIGTTAAKPLYYNGTRVGVGNTWDTNEIIEVFYDGTNYQACKWEGGNNDGVFDISAYNLTNGQPTPYIDLAAALGTSGEHVPDSYRKGGMSVKFIQGSVSSSDNKYVQYRYMGTATTGSPNPFLDTANWQGVDDEPTAGSNNLVKSGGVYRSIVFSKKEVVSIGNLELGTINTDGEAFANNTNLRTPNSNKIENTYGFFSIKGNLTAIQSIVSSVSAITFNVGYYNGSGTWIERETYIDITDKEAVAIMPNNAKYFRLIFGFSNVDISSYVSEINAALNDIIELYFDHNGSVEIEKEIQNTKKELHSEINDVADDVDEANKTARTGAKVLLPLNGKISIIGDSISSFAGTVPDGYITYYPNQELNVTEIEDTWWYMLLCAGHASLDINASYSGSYATKQGNFPSFYERANILGTPDVVIVELGTNDSRANVNLGNYDYDKPIAELSENSFIPAYIKGIKGLMQSYPSAKIILTIMQMKDAYADAIKNIAEHYNLDVYDLRSYYTGGNVHPDKAKMLKIANTFQDLFIENGFSLYFSVSNIDNIKQEGTYIDKTDGHILLVNNDSSVITQTLTTTFIKKERTSFDNGVTWGDWMEVPQKRLYRIVHPKGVNDNHTVSLSKNKFYRIECACADNVTFKLLARKNSANQIALMANGKMLSGVMNAPAITAGVYIVQFLEDIDALRITDNANGDVRIDVYEATQDEILSYQTIHDVAPYNNPIYTILKASLKSQYTWQSNDVSLIGGKLYKVCAKSDSTFKILAKDSNNQYVDIIDNNCNVISEGDSGTALTSGLFYFATLSDATILVIGDNTSPVLVEVYDQNTFVLPQDGIFTKTFPNILPNYIMPTSYDVMTKYINGAYAISQFSQIVNFSDNQGGQTNLTHDCTLIVHDGYAYALYCHNTSAYVDSASSETAQVRLKKVNLADTSDVHTYIIAQKDETYGTYVQTGGAGSPTMYNVGGILHIIYAANVDNAYIEMHTTFDTSDSTIGTYSKLTLTDGVNSGVINNTLLGQMFGNAKPDSTFNQLQMNCTIGVNSATYYAGLVWGNGDGESIIIRSTNFIDWTVETAMDFGCKGEFEIACWCKNGYLYACKRTVRPKGDNGNNIAAVNSDNALLSPFAKYDLTNHKWIAAIAVKNCCTRPAFFEYSDSLYLLTCGTTRGDGQIIKVDEMKIDNSKVIMELENRICCYGSISVYNGTVYITGTFDGVGSIIPLYTLAMNHYTNGQIRTKMLSVMQ